MKLIYIALLILAAFIGVWVLFVIPAEKRHHERKLESLRKRIAKREAALEQARYDARPARTLQQRHHKEEKR